MSLLTRTTLHSDSEQQPTILVLSSLPQPQDYDNHGVESKHYQKAGFYQSKEVVRYKQVKLKVTKGPFLITFIFNTFLYIEFYDLQVLSNGIFCVIPKKSYSDRNLPKFEKSII